MRKSVAGGFSAVFIATLLGMLPVAARPQSDAAGTIPVTTVVTALGSKFTAPPAVSKADVTLREGNRPQRHYGMDSGAGRSSRSSTSDRDR